jgi:integrase
LYCLRGTFGGTYGHQGSAVVKIRYLTSIHGQHYFQRRYPKKLEPLLAAKGIGAIYKRQLPVSPDSPPSALVAAVELESAQFQLYIDTLLNANVDTLSDIDLDNRSIEWLRQHNLKGGELYRAEIDNPAGSMGSHFRDYLLETVFEDIAYSEQKPELAVQYRAWRMVSEPARANSQTLLFSDCWKGYALSRQLSSDETEKRLIRSRKKELNRWSDFLTCVGEQEVSQDNINTALATWKRALDEQQPPLKPSSITRMLGVPVAAFNRTTEDYGLNIIVKKPKVKAIQASAKTTYTFLPDEQVRILELAQDKASTLYRPWVELYVILSLQTGTFASELQRMPSGNIKLDDPIPHIKFDGALKTQSRPRTVPLILKTHRIRALLSELNDGSGKALGSYFSGLDESAVSHALKKRCTLINKLSSAYSIRHAFAFNCDIAGISAKDKAMLGGWTGGDKAIMERYGAGARDSKEMMLRLQEANRSVCDHLISAKPPVANVTAISTKTRL